MSMLQLLRSSGGTRNGSGSSGTPAAAVSEAATSSDDAAAAAHTGALPAGAPSALQFRLPVDHEHKATALPLLSVARPHMAAFHLSWACLFVSFMTTFAPAALLPVLQASVAGGWGRVGGLRGVRRHPGRRGHHRCSRTRGTR